jgi:DNA-binding NtrC family response regulator
MSERCPRTPKAPLKLDDYPSEAMRAALHQARLGTEIDSVVLFVGEPGSGKEYFAQYVHQRSRRSNGPFLVMNCGGLAPDQMEPELFGRESDSATDRPFRRRGLLELAEGGTLVLREVAGLSLRLQEKLLEFLDTQKFSIPGSGRTIAVNARLLAATSRDLRAEAEQGAFQKELFYRLDVFPIRVPPLRERKEDLPVLVRELVTSLAAGLALGHVPEIDPNVLDILAAYHWPGNVRELRNVLERSLLVCDGSRIGADDILGTPHAAKR